ncbi:MAG TPA: hypothetical protein VMX38_02295 [Verrucomicrobiae bacterium]|nr:hypothetical protein [Verrucomicrobiae bacterium]
MNAVDAVLPADLAVPPAVSARGAKAAREFEAQLIGSLLESLEKTFATVPGDADDGTSDNFNYMGNHALAEVLAAHGGFGIADFVSQHLVTNQSPQ